MTKKPLSPKHGKKLPSKRLQELAEDDYVDPVDTEKFSDSDILGSENMDLRNSNQETHEEDAQITYAQAERLAKKSKPQPEARP